MGYRRIHPGAVGREELAARSAPIAAGDLELQIHPSFVAARDQEPILSLGAHAVEMSGVGGLQVAVARIEELPEVGASDLLLALDRENDVDGNVAGDFQEGVHRVEKIHDRRLVVARAPGDEQLAQLGRHADLPGVDDFRSEGGGHPVRLVGRHDVVHVDAEEGLGVRILGVELAVGDREPRGLDEAGVLGAQLLDVAQGHFRALADALVRRRDAGNAQVFPGLLQPLVEVRIDVREKRVVLAHGSPSMKTAVCDSLPRQPPYEIFILPGWSL